MKEQAYCVGNRVGLGSDKVHGKRVPSKEQCALLASEDLRCDGSRFFDYGTRHKQCKCPTTNNCGSGKKSIKWTIYRYDTDTQGKTLYY